MFRVFSRREGSLVGEKLASRARALLLPLSIVWLAGCATTRALFPGEEVAPLPFDSPVTSRSLETGDAWLRHYLILQDNAGAVEYLQQGREAKFSDPLLRALQGGLVTRSAGDFQRSNALLEEADKEIARRRVVSVSQTAGSYLVSDRLLSYLPAGGEIAMIPFYRMMNYLALSQPANAAVEARRISALIDERSPEELGGCRAAAMLNYGSGLVFEAAGELNDALVSLRRAESDSFGCGSGSRETSADLRYDISRIASALGLLEFVDSISAEQLASRMGQGGQGELLVLLEHGFIAHRSEGAIHVPIFEEELEDLSGEDGGVIAEVAAAVTARLISNFAERGYYGASWDDQPFVQVGQALGGAHIIRLSWPELHGSRRDLVQLRVIAADDTIPASAYTDLSAIADQKLNADRAASIARLVARGITKFVASRAVEKRAEKQGGELMGFVAARLSNLAANATERADTRGWTLLPRQVSLARVTLAAGEQELTIQSYDRAKGEWVDVNLGKVQVEPGKMTIVSRRIWNDSGDDDQEEWGEANHRLHVAGAAAPDPLPLVAADPVATVPSLGSPAPVDFGTDQTPPQGERSSDGATEGATSAQTADTAPIFSVPASPAASTPNANVAGDTAAK